jgi:hypothetical protein
VPNEQSGVPAVDARDPQSLLPAIEVPGIDKKATAGRPWLLVSTGGRERCGNQKNRERADQGRHP